MANDIVERLERTPIKIGLGEPFIDIRKMEQERKEAAAEILGLRAKLEADKLHYIDGMVTINSTNADLCRQIDELHGENTRLRAAIAQGTSACIYCSLPKDDWVKCCHGFPGCSRSDDAMGCPELGARLETDELRARLAALEAGDLVLVPKDFIDVDKALRWKLGQVADHLTDATSLK